MLLFDRNLGTHRLPRFSWIPKIETVLVANDELPSQGGGEPAIVPLGAAFGIHPVHLGIIFVANLELGFLMPLVGINIFLASYRFKRPVLDVAAAALPFMAILAAGVLVITYIPWLTTGVLGMWSR